MSNRKICFFVPFYPVVKGGGEYQARLIADELVKYNYDVFFISINDFEEGIFYIDNFKIYSIIGNPTLVNKLTLYNKVDKQIKAIFQIERPFLVYQRILNTFSYKLSKQLNFLNIQYIIHIADNYSIEFNGIKGSVKKEMFKIISQRGAKFICQTEYQAGIIKKILINQDVDIISNMHPQLNLIRTSNKDLKNVVWIGNVRPVKQLELFIKLANSLREFDLKFTIIGNIPNNNYGSILRKNISENTNIDYIGSKDNIFINNYLMKAGLLINTSESEGFSNTFIQAWLCGTPVLSLNSDPNNVIKKYGLGRFCEGDFSLLEKYLFELLDTEKYDDLSSHCVKIAEDNFLIEKNIEKFIKIISDIEKKKHV
ncbi:glycosyltransferase family 4 protein [Galbibacter sp. BG1]